MYCSKCGKKISENDMFCKFCGNKIGIEKDSVKEEITTNEVIINTKQKEEKNGLKTASIVLGIIALVGNLFIIFSFISIVLAVIGLILGICATKKGRNIAGIVLNAISIILSILFILLMIRVVRMIPNLLRSGLNTGSNIIEKYNPDNNYNFNDIIEGFNNGDFDFNDIINGFTNGEFDFFPEEFENQFDFDEYTNRFNEEPNTNEKF